MAQLTIRGVNYQLSRNVGLQAIPLFTAIGISLDDPSAIINPHLLLQRLSEPRNWHKIAYSLRAIVPGLPDDVVAYEAYTDAAGNYREMGRIDLSIDELVASLSIIMDALPKEKPANQTQQERRRDRPVRRAK